MWNLSRGATALYGIFAEIHPHFTKSEHRGMHPHFMESLIVTDLAYNLSISRLHTLEKLEILENLEILETLEKLEKSSGLVMQQPQKG